MSCINGNIFVCHKLFTHGFEHVSSKPQKATRRWSQRHIYQMTCVFHLTHRKHKNSLQLRHTGNSPISTLSLAIFHSPDIGEWNLFFSKSHTKSQTPTPSRPNIQSDRIAIQWQATQTTSCKNGETLPLKNTFSTFPFAPNLEFNHFPPPPSLSPFQCWPLKFSTWFGIASNIDKGGKGVAVWERWGKLLTRHEGKVSPLFLQLVVVPVQYWEYEYLQVNALVARELSGFTCTSSLTMNEKFQYRTRLPRAVRVHC